LCVPFQKHRSQIQKNGIIHSQVLQAFNYSNYELETI
jgi:hypothetical protein